MIKTKLHQPPKLNSLGTYIPISGKVHHKFIEFTCCWKTWPLHTSRIHIVKSMFNRGKTYWHAFEILRTMKAGYLALSFLFDIFKLSNVGEYKGKYISFKLKTRLGEPSNVTGYKKYVRKAASRNGLVQSKNRRRF
jgi:hypothetical protein